MMKTETIHGEKKTPTITPIFTSYQELAKRWGRHKNTIHRNVRSRILPKPVSLGGQKLAFIVSEIERIEQAISAGATQDEIKALVVRIETDRIREAFQ